MAISRILCPVDFSEPSRHAVQHAAALGRWFNASIAALHVYTPPFVPVPGLPPLEERLSERESERVREQVAACFREAGADPEAILIDVGNPVRRIVERAAALPADLIVLGTHGTGGFEHMILGSVTEKVLRKSGCPVLTVPPRAQATSQLPFRHVLCAIDFSDWSMAGLTLACSLAQESHARLTLVHVIEWPWEEPPMPAIDAFSPKEAAALREFRRYLERSAAARLRGLSSDPAVDRCVPATQVVHGKPYVEILRVAAVSGADLIVMGVHGRNVLDLTLVGSTTNHVVRRATCPVLTLRR